MTSSGGWLALIAGSLGIAACTSATDLPEADYAEAFSGPKTLHNPVLAVDCPDPGVLRDTDAQGAIYTMVCTTNAPDNVFRFYTSRDLETWVTTEKFVFPGTYSADPKAERHHPWASDNFWAPEIHRMPDSVPAPQKYVVYYTARHRDNHRLCIGTATAPTATGPYLESAEPIVCHEGFGVIDATYFRDDDGQAYLYWKDDGNDLAPDIRSALHGRTNLNVQRLTTDGLHLADALGKPSELGGTPLIDHTFDWEGDLVEAPWMVKREGFYYLFYSSFSYCDGRYAVGVARARSPVGPFTKNPSARPIFTSGNGFDGPGHGSAVPGPGAKDGLFFVYHAWKAGQTCNQPGSARQVLVDAVSWNKQAGDGGAWPTINGGHPSGAR